MIKIHKNYSDETICTEYNKKQSSILKNELNSNSDLVITLIRLI